MRTKKLMQIVVLAAGISLAIVRPGLSQNPSEPAASPGQEETKKEATTEPEPMTQEQCRAMMKKMGMSDAVVLRCQMLCNAEVAVFDPAAILALRSELKLTGDQIAALQQISGNAVAEAKSKLTAEQLALLQPLADSPKTMLQLCGQMMSKKHHGGEGCPMHMMMCRMPASTPEAGAHH